MKNFIISFIIVYALHVSGGFSAYHQELKNFTHSIWYVFSAWAPDDRRRNRPKHVEHRK
jgi:hypothetical protein